MDRPKIATIPLFPLGLVLFPGITLPLHIFEERYRVMVADCLEGNREFGVVYHDRNGMKDVGCIAGIENVVQEYEDGRSDIVTVGSDRFQILKLYDEGLYLRADVAVIEDEPEPEEELAELTEHGVDLIDRYLTLRGEEMDAEAVSEMPPDEISFVLASIEFVPTVDRQEMLESRLTSRRIERSSAILDPAIRREQQIKAIRDKLGMDEDMSNIHN
jgi:Lon protease-like protein